MQSCIIPSLRKRPDVFIQKKAWAAVILPQAGLFDFKLLRIEDLSPAAVECNNLAGEIGVFSS